MEQNELNYKKTLSSIGWMLVIFWGCMQIYAVMVSVLQIVLEFLPLSDMWSYVIYQLFYGAGYLAVFMLPVLFLKPFLSHSGCTAVPMELGPRVSYALPFLIFASVAVCYAFATVNSFLLELFDYSDFTSEILFDTMGDTAPYRVVLNFIVIAVVPAFCEEFLFRGAILGNLLPFGRANAIIVSSLFFALMHQNAGQILYTFAAGIALGLIYAHTNSIWNCTAVHLINNFISVLQEVVYESLGNTAKGNAVLLLTECAVYLLGAVSIAILFLFAYLQKKKHTGGVFGKTLPSSDAHACYPIGRGQGLRLFFRPSVILFIALCAIQILLLILLAIGGMLV